MSWKKIVAVAALVALLMITAVVVILSRYDLNDLKPQITRVAKEATGRDLILGGNIDLKIGFKPKLLVENVSFENASWGSEPKMAQVRRVEVQVALLPLIRRKIEIKRLILVEPDILIETDKSGRTNLEFKDSKKTAAPKPEKKEAEPGRFELPALAFEDLRIEKGRLTYKDARKNKALTVKIEKLGVRAAGSESPLNLDLKGEFNGTPFMVESTMGALTKLADPDKTWPIKLAAKAVDSTLTLDGTVQDISGPRGFQLQFELKSKDMAKLERFAGTPLPLSGRLDISAHLIDTAPDSYKISDLKAKAGDMTLTLDGTIQDPTGKPRFETRFSFAGEDLANLEQVIGKPLPLKGPFNISAHLAGPAPDIYKISDLKATIGRSSLEGSLEADLSSKKPHLSASLSSDTLDLRPFFPKKDEKKEKDEETSKPKKEKVFPRDQLPIESLAAVDAKFKSRIGHLLTPSIAVNNFELDMSLKNGHLKLKPVMAVIGGGTLNGYVDIEPKHKTLTLTATLKIDQLDVGRMLKELDITDVVYGKMDAEVNLKGQGQSVAALMAGLNGKTQIIMNKGRIQNKYINLLGSDMTAGIFRLINPLKEKTDFTGINCFVSLFDIKDGLADSTALVLSTDSMNVIGEGDINLKTETLDFSLKPVPKEGMPGISLSLGELTKPFKLGGTLANPSLGIDPAQTAIAIGKVLGGVALFGPVGIAAALIGGKSGDENPCLTAIEASQQGVGTQKKTPSGKKKSSTKPAGGTGENSQGLGKTLKSLFGN